MYSHKLSIAPMLDWTDRHCRYFLRQLSQHAVLYTEMVTTGAILYGKGDYLGFNHQEHPLVLQLGGSDAKALAECAKIAEDKGYDELNLNVGCPSDRVQNGRFGACLMAEPELVAEAVTAMKNSCNIPVTVKSRIGIDDQDSYEFLTRFVDIVSSAGCEHFIVHARKAWLSGLSPKQNREIPPLDYARVYQLKQDYPKLFISINGGIKSLNETLAHLKYLDGVMIGREAYHNPYMLAEADKLLFDSSQPIKSRADIIDVMCEYIDAHVADGGRPWHILRHMLGLFNGQPGGKRFRRYLSEHSSKSGADSMVLRKAFELIE